MTPEAIQAIARRVAARAIERQRMLEGLEAVLARPESDPARRRVVELLDRARSRKEAAERG